MASPLSAELARRHSNTEKVLALFRSRPWQWIGTRELEQIGGRNAWRTRLSEARRVFCEEQDLPFPVKDKERDPIPNRQSRIVTFNEATGHLTQVEEVISEYRYVTYARLGRDATVPAPKLKQRTFFELHKSAAAQ